MPALLTLVIVLLLLFWIVTVPASVAGCAVVLEGDSVLIVIVWILVLLSCGLMLCL